MVQVSNTDDTDDQRKGSTVARHTALTEEPWNTPQHPHVSSGDTGAGAWSLRGRNVCTGEHVSSLAAWS